MRPSFVTALASLASLAAIGATIRFGPELWDLTLATSARADPPLPLGPLRQRLATCQTLVSRVTYTRPRPCGGGPEGKGAPCEGVLRFDRSTGHVTWDHGERVTWDGTHLWWDNGRPLAVQLGPEADAFAASLIGEVFSGFPNSTITLAGREDWVPFSRMSGGTYLVDLPGTWDDPYAILFQVSGPDSLGFTLTVLDRVTREMVTIPSPLIGLQQVGIRTEVNVRLEPDLDQVESIGSRTVVLEVDPEWGQITATAGPVFLPPYHELSTRMVLPFDPATSQGTVVDGVEKPYTQLGPLACPGPGGPITVPIDLVFRVDPTHEFYAFLVEAADAGCPFRLGAGVVEQLDIGAAATATLQANLVARTGATVLASKSVQRSAQGPAHHKSDIVPVLSVAPATPIEPDDLTIALQGNLTLTCSGASAQTTLIRVGFVEEKQPTIVWDGCYPEYGTTPDPNAEVRPLFAEYESPL